MIPSTENAQAATKRNVLMKDYAFGGEDLADRQLGVESERSLSLKYYVFIILILIKMDVNYQLLMLKKNNKSSPYWT